jgi:hypothetical protein
MKRRKQEERSERREIDARVKELDRHVDASFLSELAPVLERAQRSRDEQRV